MLTLNALVMLINLGSVSDVATRGHSARLLVQADAETPVEAAPAAEEAPPPAPPPDEVRSPHRPDPGLLLSLEEHDARLIHRRGELLDQKPGLGLPVGMFIGSAGAAFLSFLLIYSSLPLLPYVPSAFSSTYGAGLGLLVLLEFVVGIVAGVAHVVMGVVGATQMDKRMKDRAEIDERIERIDVEVREVEAKMHPLPRL